MHSQRAFNSPGLERNLTSLKDRIERVQVLEVINKFGTEARETQTQGAVSSQRLMHPSFEALND